jgi:hypothetical protein
MRIIVILLIIPLLQYCGTNEKPEGINLLITDEQDTVSYFYYDNGKLAKYRVYDRQSNLDSVIQSKSAQSKIRGDLVFGIKSKENPLNYFLVFRGVLPRRFELATKPQTQFLDEEFGITSNYRVDLTENYIDSTTSPIRKIETFAAIRNHTNDTILFQDNIYAFRDKKMDEVILSIVVYDNDKTREEMRLLLNDAVTKMKTSIRDTLMRTK